MNIESLNCHPTETVRDKVYLTLKQLIMENELKVGESYLEEQLASRLNVSRTPVREAAIQLERDGFVKVRPRHGLIVLSISIQDMREIYQIRTELESLAVELIARRGLTDTEFASLIECIIKMEAALDCADMKQWASADREFHCLILHYSQNQRLEHMMAQLRDQVHRARIVTMHLRAKPTQSNSDHELLIQHLRNRDEVAAGKLHRSHLTRAGNLLINLLEENGLNDL